MSASPVQRARAYLKTIPPAVSGQQGHNTCFNAACRCVEFNCTKPEALSLLAEWNSRNLPPFSEAELVHKVDDAFRKGTVFPFRPNGPVRPVRRLEKVVIQGKLTPIKKLVLPPFIEKPDVIEDKCEELGKNRGLDPNVIMFAHQERFIRFGTWWNRPAWFIVDPLGKSAQARRMDGKPFRDGVKAVCLPGSRASWPIGCEHSLHGVANMLVEGGPDFLAGTQMLFGVAAFPVCMLGASHYIPEDALPFFEDKHFWIYPHNDEAGGEAFKRWHKQIAAVTDSVYRRSVEPCKDLNEFVSQNRHK